MSTLNYPLSNIQVELMKLFSTNLSDNDLIELKDLLAKFYAEKAIAKADQIWDTKGLSNDDMEKWLDENS
jgi:hypothetical protein